MVNANPTMIDTNLTVVGTNLIACTQRRKCRRSLEVVGWRFPKGSSGLVETALLTSFQEHTGCQGPTILAT